MSGLGIHRTLLGVGDAGDHDADATAGARRSRARWVAFVIEIVVIAALVALFTLGMLPLGAHPIDPE